MDRRGFLLAGSLFALTGCMKEQTSRSQLDDDAEKASIRVIGDVSTIDNAGNIPVSGIAMVVGLQGTGGGTPPGNYRDAMKEFLKRKKIDEPDRFLDSPDHALVLVTAEIPAGIRAGQRTDVKVTLPPGSKVRSLRGGYLMPCELSTYAAQSEIRDYVGQMNPDARARGEGDRLLRGSVLAEAEGPLQIPLKREDADVLDPEAFQPNTNIKTCWIWRGARCYKTQPLFIVLNTQEARYRMALQVADRINSVLHDSGSENKLADAKRKEVVSLHIPPQYRLNLPHFLRMVRMIPLDGGEESSSYRQKLELQLREPETTLIAALRLEALGRSSIPVLKAVMKESEYPLVRFASAEALAYLGEPIASQELAKLTLKHPALQAYCLTALASLDESASNVALQDLMASNQTEVRYGAFRALREMGPSVEITRGVLMNQCFWVHRVAPDATPMVHLLTSKRAEIVLYGTPLPALKPGFALRAGPDIVLSSRATDKVCTISRFSTTKGNRQEQCSLSLPDILKMMAELGATYSDVAEMLKEASDTKALNCPLAFDALPKLVPIPELAETGRTDRMLEKEAALLEKVAADSASNPSLYERGNSRSKK